MIKPYNETHFDLLASWITDPDLLFQFAGTDFHYPITEHQLTIYQQRNPERHFYIGYTNDVDFAFGEIIPQAKNSFRLGRLLVGNPEMRGKGFGFQFVNDLVLECKTTFNASVVDLYVWEDNLSAIRCYKKAGFSFTNEPSFLLQHNQKQFTIHKMSLTVQ